MNVFKRAISLALRGAGLPRPHGRLGIWLDGHRGQVGGLWDEIGRLQYDFLIGRGLEPRHVLLDIGCGALRGGRFFIPYLDEGHYLGIDSQRELIEAGLRHELDTRTAGAKRPEFLVDRHFAFERFSKRPDYAIAQSLFTHLTAESIGLCLRSLRRVAPDHLRLYATFAEARTPGSNPAKDHPHEMFAYTREQMEHLGEEHGWRTAYLGDWRHPRGQKMLEFRPSSLRTGGP